MLLYGFSGGPANLGGTLRGLGDAGACRRCSDGTPLAAVSQPLCEANDDGCWSDDPSNLINHVPGPDGGNTAPSGFDIGALATGLVRGFVGSSQPKPIAQPTSFFTSPIGIGVIAVAAIATVILLRK